MKMRSSVFVLLVLLVSGRCDEQGINATLRFYHGSTGTYTELPLEEAKNIFLLTSWYNISRDTVIYTHGFTGRPEGKAVLAVIGAYLTTNAVNVALLNWEHLATGSRPNLPTQYSNWAVPNTRKLGNVFAETLESLQVSGLQLDRTHLVGHSLGAQLFGITGNNLSAKGIHLPWITGLDPASRDFENKPLSSKLHSGSADFVDIIHSDPTKYGYKRSIGTVDFWPNYRNGAVTQPGCNSSQSTLFTPGDLCNHNRCWELMVDALRYPDTIIGSYAKNYRKWKKYNDTERMEITLELGKRPIAPTPGNYYLVTRDSSPYGLGIEGL